jgi:hypothetical protein
MTDYVSANCDECDLLTPLVCRGADYGRLTAHWAIPEDENVSEETLNRTPYCPGSFRYPLEPPPGEAWEYGAGAMQGGLPELGKNS